MKRRITVLYQVHDCVHTAVFTCEYQQVGDFSYSWHGQNLSLRMRKGHDDQGVRVYAKVFLYAWEITISDV